MSWSFLIDANLPIALVGVIEGLGHQAAHVLQIRAERMPD